MWAELMVRRRPGAASSSERSNMGLQPAPEKSPIDSMQAIELYARQTLLQTPQKRGKLQPNKAFAVQAQNKNLALL